MAIVAENTSNGTVSGAVLTVAHTCTGTESDGMLIVTVQVTDTVLGDRTISGVTHNGEVCTHLIGADSDDGVEARTEIWYRVNPTTGGTPDIVVTAGGKATDLSLGAVSFTGVDDSGVSLDNYYFDASDSGPTDDENVWTDDGKGFDGLTGLGNGTAYDNTGGDGGENSRELKGGGTTAPISGDAIITIEARAYGFLSSAGGTFHAKIYEDGGGTSLGEITSTATGFFTTSYLMLDTHLGGWTWQKVNDLEVKVWFTGVDTGGTNDYAFDKVELRVQSSSGIVIKTATGDSTPPTLDITTVGTSSFVVDSLSSRESAGAKIATSTTNGVVIHKTDVGSDTHAATYVDAGTAGSQTMSYSDDDADTVWVMSAVAVTIAVSGAFEVSVTDGVELGDETSETMAAVPTITDGIKGGDETVELSVLEVAVTDGSEFGDTALGVILLSLAVTDGIKLGDTTLEDMLASPSVTDGFKSGDSTSELGTMETLVSDGIKLGDTTLGVILLLLSLTDGIKIGDTTAEDMATDSSVTDGVKLGDSAIGEMSSIVVVTDGLKLGDTTVLIMTASPVVTDGSLFGDTLLIQVGIVTFQLSVSDGIELGDNTSQIMSTFSVVSDGIKLGDSTSENILATVLITDGIKGGDTTVNVLAVYPVVTDGAIFSDTVVVEIGGVAFELSVTDGVKIGDATASEMATFTVISDGVKLGDVRIVEMASDVSISDGVKLGDITVGNVNYSVIVSDGFKMGDLTTGTLTAAPRGAKNLGQSVELKLYLKMLEQMSKRRID